MSKVVCFGEIMMRLSPEGYRGFLQADRLENTFAGTESNVAQALTLLGGEASLITKLPEHDIGQCAINSMRKYGVDTSKIVRGGERIGILYLQKGYSQRATKAIYDRAGSSLALARRDEFDWDAILRGADWFHFSGITPALGGELPAICSDALDACISKGIKTSCDLNYRAKLWTKRLAAEVMCPLLSKVDIYLGGLDICDIFGMDVSGIQSSDWGANLAGYEDVLRRLCANFGFERAAVSLRDDISANINDWAGAYYDGHRAYISRKHNVHIIDRIGGGDSFVAGMIHAIRKGFVSSMAVEFAAAVSCLKHTMETDVGPVTEADALALIERGGAGRVQR